MYELHPETVNFLLNNRFKVETTQTGLSPGTMVQVFADRMVLPSDLPDTEQTLVVEKTAAYIQAQQRDGVAWGHGESFSIGAGELIQVGKNTYKRQPILVPAQS